MTLKSGTGNITSMNCATINTNDTFRNSLIVGKGPNAWLFDEYAFVLLNACCLGLAYN